jgi:hypothetical protein
MSKQTTLSDSMPLLEYRDGRFCRVDELPDWYLEIDKLTYLNTPNFEELG